MRSFTSQCHVTRNVTWQSWEAWRHVRLVITDRELHKKIVREIILINWYKLFDCMSRHVGVVDFKWVSWETTPISVPSGRNLKSSLQRLLTKRFIDGDSMGTLVIKAQAPWITASIMLEWTPAVDGETCDKSPSTISVHYGIASETVRMWCA